MIRFIRGLIYAAFAAITAAVVLDWLDRGNRRRPVPKQVKSSSNSGASVDSLDDGARKALLDELAAQV